MSLVAAFYSFRDIYKVLYISDIRINFMLTFPPGRTLTSKSKELSAPNSTDVTALKTVCSKEIERETCSSFGLE